MKIIRKKDCIKIRSHITLKISILMILVIAILSSIALFQYNNYAFNRNTTSTAVSFKTISKDGSEKIKSKNLDIDRGRILLPELSEVDFAAEGFEAPVGTLNGTEYTKRFMGWKVTYVAAGGTAKVAGNYVEKEHFTIEGEIASITAEAVWGYTVYVSGSNGSDNNNGLSGANQLGSDGTTVESGPVRTLGRAYELLARYDSGITTAHIDHIKGGNTTNYGGAIVITDNFLFKDDFEGMYKYQTDSAGKFVIVKNHYVLQNVANTYTEPTGATSYGRMRQYNPFLRVHYGRGLQLPKHDKIVTITSNDTIKGTDYRTAGAKFTWYDFVRHSLGGDTVFKDLNMRFRHDGNTEQEGYIGGLAAYGNHVVFDEGVTVDKTGKSAANVAADKASYLPNIYGGNYSYRYADRATNGQGSSLKLGDSGGTTVNNTRVTIKSGTFLNIHGGSYGQYAGNPNVENVDSKGLVTNIYGGEFTQGIGGAAHESATSYHTFVYIYGLSANCPTVCGSAIGSGGNLGTDKADGASNVYIKSTSGYKITTLYGGTNVVGNGKFFGTANITIDGGTIDNIYGGSNIGEVKGNVNLNINGGTFKNLVGGGTTGPITGKVSINLTGGTISDSLYCSGAGNTAQVAYDYMGKGITGGEVGSNEVTYFHDDLAPQVKDEPYSRQYTSGTFSGYYFHRMLKNAQGEYNGQVYHEYTRGVNSQQIYYLRRKTSELSLAEVGNVELNISGTANINCNVYGGGKVSKVLGDTSINVNGGTIKGNIFGGGDGTVAPTIRMYYATGATTTAFQTFTWTDDATQVINYDKKTVYSPNFKDMGSIQGNTNVKITAGSVSGDVYGGGNNGNVFGNAKVDVKGGTIGGNVFSAGNSAKVQGDTDVTISGTPVIQKSVFGGGNKADVGTEQETSKTNVTIVGGTIKQNVYGGGNSSVVYGHTQVSIGQNATTQTGLTPGNIIIEGTVFGGSEQKDATGEGGEFSSVSVTEGTDIVIDGAGHNGFEIKGSIFGSGNSSTIEGISNITIRNFGTTTPKRLVSIQRVDNLLVEKSNIRIEGTTDSTNDFPTEDYTLNRIKELSMKQSTLYLVTGSNLLEKFKSLNMAGLPALMDNSNKIFMAKGKNLKVTTTQDATSYGDITGMTYLGIFDKDTSGVGIYDPSLVGTTATESMINQINQGTYVLGAHSSSPVNNGFYSNYGEAGEQIHQEVINPTPQDQIYHYWRVGEEVENVEITLLASRNTVEGKYYNLPLSEMYPNTKFEMADVDISNLLQGVKLINSNDIPNKYPTNEEANKTFGIQVRTGNIGWANDNKLNLLTDPPYFTQDQENFITENARSKPNLEFYLTNAINLDEEGSAGYITFQLKGNYKINQLDEGFKTINVKININRQTVGGNSYEAVVTPGKQYDRFGHNTTNITQNGSLSLAFTELNRHDVDPYSTNFDRRLKIDKNLPVNTKITLIDLHGVSNPNIYTYKVDGTSKNTFFMSDFIKVGTTDEAYELVKYYDTTTKIFEEGFIFIIDFEDATTKPAEGTYKVQFDLINTDNSNSLITIDPSSLPNATFDITNASASAKIDLNANRNQMNVKDKLNFSVGTVITQAVSGNTTIFDTIFKDKKMGLEIELLKDDGTGNYTRIDIPTGIAFQIDSTVAYPDSTGNARILLADNAISILKTLTLDTTNMNGLPEGKYKLKTKLIIADDGLYDGGESNNIDEAAFEVIKSPEYGLDAKIDAKSRLVDTATGNTQNGNNQLQFTLPCNYAELVNPSIKVKAYKRDTYLSYNFNYSQIDFNALTDAVSGLEQIITQTPSATNNYEIELKENIPEGVYRFEFILLDGTEELTKVPMNIIVK